MTVNDSAGHQANATTNVTVKNGFGLPPQINSFVADPSSVAISHITYLVVNATSRSGTPTKLLSYAYIGLPPGCGTFNQTNLSCIPSQPGTYKVWVRVTDGYAQFNQTFLTLTVTGSVPSNGTGTGGTLSKTDEVLIIVGIVVVVAAIAAVLLVRGRRKPPTPGSNPAQFPLTGATPKPEEASATPPAGPPPPRS